MNGNVSGTFAKGFICPLGQICQVSPTNPQGDLQGYDNVFMAALQVVVIASANTVSGDISQYLQF
jgi:voltage-dependent calcium channel